MPCKKTNVNKDKDIDNMMKLYKKTTLYVVRCDKNNNLQDSAPCCNCLNTMIELNIKRIVYSSSDNDILSANPKDLKIDHLSSGERLLRKRNMKNKNKSKK